MTSIVLYEFAPTRSLKCRWALQEAGLAFESRGNGPEVFATEALTRVHPLGRLPAALIDGRPLFESSAINAAIADLVPDQALIPQPGSWARAQHDQWTSFAATELEIWAWGSVLNTRELLFPADRHLPGVVDQNRELFRRSAPALEAVLSEHPYVLGERFQVTDINVAYALYLGEGLGYLDEWPHLQSYLARLRARPACALPAG